MIKENCFSELKNDVISLCRSDEGKNIIDSRNIKITKVAETIGLFKDPKPTEREFLEKCIREDEKEIFKKYHAWFSSSQKLISTSKPNERYTINLQAFGKQIGELTIKKINNTILHRFATNKKYKTLDNGFDPNFVPWKDQRENIDSILNVIYNNQNSNDNKNEQERSIQWQLVYQIANEYEMFKNMQPVRWLGCPTEIGVCIKSPQKNILHPFLPKGKNVGTIDLLLRDTNDINKKQGAAFTVIELKSPSTNETLEKALVQSIDYAIALGQEANRNEDTKKAYRMAFGSKGKNSLSFGAIAVFGYKDETKDDLIKESKELLKKYAPVECDYFRYIKILLYKWNVDKHEVDDFLLFPPNPA